MRDATTELRKAYLQLLSNITVDGLLIPVYAEMINDSIKPYSLANKPKHYVILNNQNSFDRSNKQTFDFLHTIQSTVYTWYPKEQGSSVLAEKIDEIIKDRVITQRGVQIPVTGFNCYMSKVDLSRGDTEFTTQNYIFKRITIFNHFIEQA